jgi:hypothetical protein
MVSDEDHEETKEEPPATWPRGIWGSAPPTEPGPGRVANGDPEWSQLSYDLWGEDPVPIVSPEEASPESPWPAGVDPSPRPGDVQLIPGDPLDSPHARIWESEDRERTRVAITDLGREAHRRHSEGLVSALFTSRSSHGRNQFVLPERWEAGKRRRFTLSRWLRGN